MFRYQTNVVDGKGTFRRGSTSAYIGPTWRIKPGDRVIVDYVNLLPKMEFQAVDETEPSPMAQPLNLHTHGLTISPAGNSDNVLLQVPMGRSNTYVFKIPKKHNHELYWYHPHVHGITNDQVYEGLAGFIVVGRADGDYRQFNRLKIRDVLALEEMALADAKNAATTGTPVPFTIVSVDGTPMPTPIVLDGDHASRGYLLGQGGGVAILV
ncbi:MAG: hypothetical protein EXQ69_00840 [Acidimicrobiia bacterium]|nr:hypothetical protein [Acidimicrobiia bacterium]